MNEFENNEKYTSENPAEENSVESTQQETAEQNTAAENSNVENNTTYHYSYASANNQNQSNYYNPNPQQSYAQYNTNNAYRTEPVVHTEDAQPKKKNKTVVTLVVIFTVCAFLAIAGLFAAAAGLGKNDNSNNNTNTTNPSAQVETEDQAKVPDKNSTGDYTVRGVVDKVIDSCVGITVYTEATNYINFYGYGSQ